MSDGESTAIQKKTDRSFSELVRAGANLSSEEWDEARIAAARKSLPTRFRDLPSTIAYLARAKRSGLDPFMNELWAWEDERGDLTFMTGRDGWLRIAREDPNVEGLEFGIVYEEDDFQLRQEGGEVFVTHNWSFPRGSLIGAYCVVHMAEGEGDHAEWREMEDYSHLMGKKNWQNNPKDMLQTRVISAAVKVKSPAGAGLYSPEDFIMEEEGDRYVREQVGGETDAKAAALAEELEREEAIEVESEEEPEEGKEPEDTSSASEADTEPVAEPEPEAEPEEEEEEPKNVEPCPVCTEPLSPNQKGGHMGGHSRSGVLDDELKELIGIGFRVADSATGFYVMDPDGTLHGDEAGDGGYAGWKPALGAMKRVARETGYLEDEHDTETQDEPEVEEPDGIPENAPDWVREPDDEFGDPVDLVLTGGEGVPEGWGVLKIVYGAGQFRHRAVALNENGQVREPVGPPYVSRRKAVQEAQDAAEDAEPESEATDEEADEADDWTGAYKACVTAMEEVGRPGDMEALYNLAEKLYPDAVDEEKGKVQLTKLSGEQLHNLAAEIREELG